MAGRKKEREIENIGKGKLVLCRPIGDNFKAPMITHKQSSTWKSIEILVLRHFSYPLQTVQIKKFLNISMTVSSTYLGLHTNCSLTKANKHPHAYSGKIAFEFGIYLITKEICSNFLEQSLLDKKSKIKYKIIIILEWMIASVQWWGYTSTYTCHKNRGRI